MQAEELFPLLFSPLAIGRRRVKNRIVFPATLPNYATANSITDRMIHYYAARARGGAGMIVTEGLSVHPTSVPQPAVVTLYEDRNRNGLKRLAAEVESADCRLIGQLWHVGRQQLWNPVISPVGVSAEPDAYSWTVPHVLSTDAIKSIIEGFASSARVLKEAGFSGAELHGAHGYLITQFMSPWSNTRDDEYGGDRERRLRFVRELIAAIRAECGAEFVLGLKMPGNEGVRGGIDVAEAEKIVELLIRHGGLDYFAFSQGNFSLSLEDHVPDMHYDPGPFLGIHKTLRRACGQTPVMALGRVVGPAEAENVVHDGVADLVATSRALVSDAAWPRKAQQGKLDSIRPCIFCNVCWGEIHVGKPMACIHNPHLATPDEATWSPSPARIRKKLIVVGAGVAGLEAAWVAAARGHAVEIFGRTPSTGGKARQEASLPGRGEVAKVYEFQTRQAREHGVLWRLGETATPASVRQADPDAIIVATGAAMRRPQTLTPSSQGMSLRDYLANPPLGGHQAGTAVLFDQDHTAATYAAADLLAARYDRLVIVTPRVHLARNVAYVSVIGIYRRLYNAGVQIITASVPLSCDQRTLSIANAFTGEETRLEGVTLFLWSTPRVAEDSLAAALRQLPLEVQTIGDCHAPRSMLAAIHEAHAAATAV